MCRDYVVAGDRAGRTGDAAGDTRGSARFCTGASSPDRATGAAEAVSGSASTSAEERNKREPKVRRRGPRAPLLAVAAWPLYARSAQMQISGLPRCKSRRAALISMGTGRHRCSAAGCAHVSLQCAHSLALAAQNQVWLAGSLLYRRLCGVLQPPHRQHLVRVWAPGAWRHKPGTRGFDSPEVSLFQAFSAVRRPLWAARWLCGSIPRHVRCGLDRRDRARVARLSPAPATPWGCRRVHLYIAAVAGPNCSPSWFPASRLTVD